MCRGARATVMNPIHSEKVERDKFITIHYFNIFIFFGICVNPPIISLMGVLYEWDCEKSKMVQTNVNINSGVET